MGTKTLLQLRTSARQRANMENSTFVTDAEFNGLINSAISELRDLIISKVGDDYFCTLQAISLTGDSQYALPADHYKTLKVEILGNDGEYYPVRRYENFEQPRGSGGPIQYRLRADYIVFSPASTATGLTAQLSYVPVLAELSADGSTLNGYNGWEEYVILRAAISALDKEEQDTGKLDLSLERLRLRIEAMAPNRDQFQPKRIQDTRRESSGWGEPWI